MTRIESILGYPEFARDLGAGLGLIRPGDPEGEWDAFITRVRGRFETSRNYRVVVQFLDNHSRLTDQELVRLFEFIYSKLVNKFKGEIGEALAARAIFDFRRSSASRWRCCTDRISASANSCAAAAGMTVPTRCTAGAPAISSTSRPSPK